MKSLVKILNLAVLLLIASHVAAVNVEPGFNIQTSGKKTLHFDGKEMLLQDFEISFHDKKGKSLFSEYVTNPSTFDRDYNLEELPVGKYYLLIQMDNSTLLLPFYIEKDGLKVNLEKLKPIQ